MKTKVYSVKKTKKQVPAILGMPGFVGTLKGGRIEQILQELSQRGILGLGMMYDGIEKNVNKVICNFNLKKYLKNMQKAFEILYNNPKIDNERIGVIASSISGAIFAYGIVNNKTNGISPKAYAGISPLMGWPYFGTEEQRYLLKIAAKRKAIDEFEITSVYDAQRGIKRVIPIECIKEMEEIDGIAELEKIPLKNLEVLTLIGNLDERASPSSMERAHYALGGKPDGIRRYITGHALPIGDIKEPVVEFFERALKSA